MSFEFLVHVFARQEHFAIVHRRVAVSGRNRMPIDAELLQVFEELPDLFMSVSLKTVVLENTLKPPSLAARTPSMASL